MIYIDCFLRRNIKDVNITPDIIQEIMDTLEDIERHDLACRTRRELEMVPSQTMDIRLQDRYLFII